MKAEWCFSPGRELPAGGSAGSPMQPPAPRAGTPGRGWPEPPSARAEGRDGGRRQEGTPVPPASPSGAGRLDERL